MRFARLAVVCVGTLLVAAPSAAATTVSFGFDGTPHLFVVPAGVDRIAVVAVGGVGAPGSTSPGGGRAARVSGAVGVRAGSKLGVVVAGNAFNALGGFNGGGNGAGSSGGGGGGFSAVYVCNPDSCPEVGSRMLAIAAGGGGGGGTGELGLDRVDGFAGGNAGARGAPTGRAEEDSQNHGGFPGTGSAGGAGGPGGECYGAFIIGPAGYPGGSGGAFQGGTGGLGGDPRDRDSDGGGGNGGGGGGGLFGGGGGGEGGGRCHPSGAGPDYSAGGGGGAGGSSLVPSGGGAAIGTAGTPFVRLTYTRCVVPAVTGKRLAQAKAMLREAYCGVGAVHRPKTCHKQLIVTKQSLKAGTPHVVGTKVGLTAVCK